MTKFVIFFILLNMTSSASATEAELTLSYSQAYEYVTSFAKDPVYRKERPINVRLSDKIAFVGFAHKSSSSAADVIELKPNLHQMKLKLALIHELVHIVRHSYNPNEVAWLDEGLAKLLEVQYSTVWAISYQDRLHLNGYIHLSENLEDFKPESYEYVSSYFFMQYLYNHFGGDQLITEILKNKHSGWGNIISSIQKLSEQKIIKIPSEDLNKRSIWRHFAASLYFNDAFMEPYALFQLDPQYQPFSACKQ